MSLVFLWSIFLTFSYGINAIDKDISQSAVEYPYSAIGSIQINNISCTGALIGDQLAVTAAQCVLDDMGNPIQLSPGQAQFKLKRKQAVFGIKRIYKQSDYWKEGWNQQAYALIQLQKSRNILDRPLLLPDANELDQTFGKAEVEIAFYSTTTNTLILEKCSAFFPQVSKNEPNQILKHNCNPNALGAPLFVRYSSSASYLVGIIIGQNQGVLSPFIKKQAESIPYDPTVAYDDSTQINETQSSSQDSTTGSIEPVFGDRSPVADDADQPDQAAALDSNNDRDNSNDVDTIWICMGIVVGAWVSVTVVLVRESRKYNRRGSFVL
jgi:hypothetical protein